MFEGEGLFQWSLESTPSTQAPPPMYKFGLRNKKRKHLSYLTEEVAAPLSLGSAAPVCDKPWAALDSPVSLHEGQESLCKGELWGEGFSEER